MAKAKRVRSLARGVRRVHVCLRDGSGQGVSREGVPHSVKHALYRSSSATRSGVPSAAKCSGRHPASSAQSTKLPTSSSSSGLAHERDAFSGFSADQETS